MHVRAFKGALCSYGTECSSWSSCWIKCAWMYNVPHKANGNQTPTVTLTGKVAQISLDSRGKHWCKVPKNVGHGNNYQTWLFTLVQKVFMFKLGLGNSLQIRSNHNMACNNILTTDRAIVPEPCSRCFILSVTQLCSTKRQTVKPNFCKSNNLSCKCGGKKQRVAIKINKNNVKWQKLLETNKKLAWKLGDKLKNTKKTVVVAKMIEGNNK